MPSIPQGKTAHFISWAECNKLRTSLFRQYLPSILFYFVQWSGTSFVASTATKGDREKHGWGNGAPGPIRTGDLRFRKILDKYTYVLAVPTLGQYFVFKLEIFARQSVVH